MIIRKSKIIYTLLTMVFSFSLVLLDFRNIAMSNRNILYRVNTSQKIVALTFDDGPDPRFTPDILDILQQYHCKATFFVVGQNLELHQNLVKRALAEGHEVGNHTMSHTNLHAIPQQAVFAEINNCSQSIAALTGVAPKFFRPPVGITNPSIEKTASNLGMVEVHWTVAIENQSAPTPEAMARRVLERVRPGSIILLHDGRLDRSKTVQSLPLLLQGLDEKGYQAVTLTQLLKTQTEEVLYEVK
ncbi:polysaccharide deacetylase [Desulfotomaculum nigrificans CO-1-SRB]|uniref:Polysaccharide deacetylase n=1 Tax=Desulfotomaculum nigrificans (strain DSM 14880 / VKM B-2319 / CO-1-SRB) TaxID=868595 RepID=F6B6E3_DESCC|nr:polysaccharide deacetylase family protein [Desulfotomaculum nigrificans]AEF93214.1 polysaccharide deacetylase [Desulfotomaculum nigrificans CO-1-SRB]